jgi:hypothetical protein
MRGTPNATSYLLVFSSFKHIEIYKYYYHEKFNMRYVLIYLFIHSFNLIYAK